MKRWSLLFAAVVLVIFAGCANVSQSLNKTFKDTKAFIDKKLFNKQQLHSDKDVLLILLDGSGSMEERDSSGQVKISAARNTLKDILNKVDVTKVNVSLMTFNYGCRSTKILVPPTNNIDEVIKEANDLRPFGKTPLAYSIKEIDKFIAQIKKPVKVIIITDGIETCYGDPVKEAKALKQKYETKIDFFLIGYGVDQNAQRSLAKIAKAANGHYVDAQNGEALNKAIMQISQRLRIVSKEWEGDTFKFSINFDSGSFKIKKKYYPQIHRLAQYLIKTEYGAEIQGHTDSVGNAKYNQWLSQKRAQAVVDALVKEGVPQERLYAVGYGEYAPIASNDTREGRFLNRRVEAHIIKDGKLDISHLNKTNFQKATNVKNATRFSFVGYYKILDTKRSYDAYRCVVALYSNGKGEFKEFFYKRAAQKTMEPLQWEFNRKKRTLLLDFTDGGVNPQNATFIGRLKGNINKFYGYGHWANKKPGTILILRVTKEEYDCIVANGKYENGQCLY